MLFNEAHALQERLKRPTKKHEINECDKQITSGKISNAMRCLTEESKGGVLNINQKIGDKTVLQILQDKHPKPEVANPTYIVKDQYENSVVSYCNLRQAQYIQNS